MAAFFYSLLLCKIFLVTITVESLERDSAIEGTELELAFVVHRHGDRTPVHESLRLVKDTIDMGQVEQLVEPWGWGQLTDEGKRRGYRTGKFIRRRYHDQLSWKYNFSEIYIRSTDATRAKMTVLTALSAIYPVVGETWNSCINWVPVPYTTVPEKYDSLLYVISCPAYMAVGKKLRSAPSISMVENHGDLLEKLTRILNFDLTAHPALAYFVFDAFTSLIPLGYKVEPEILDLMPELKDAAGEAMDIIYGAEDYLDLIAGPLLNEFFTEAAKVIAKEKTQKIRIYSSHDVVVYGFEAATGVVNKQGVPSYGAVYSLELRRVVKTGEYVVLPVYLETPEVPEVYLQLQGCEGHLCPYEIFYDKTSSNAISEAQWRKRCHWSDDVVVYSDEFL